MTLISCVSTEPPSMLVQSGAPDSPPLDFPPFTDVPSARLTGMSPGDCAVTCRPNLTEISRWRRIWNIAQTHAITTSEYVLHQAQRDAAASPSGIPAYTCACSQDRMACVANGGRTSKPSPMVPLSASLSPRTSSAWHPVQILCSLEAKVQQNGHS